jgi:TPR repeat protein
MCCIARHLLLSGLGLLVLLLSSCASRTDAGQAAYQSGDFATAYATWLPSAEAGDAAAQYLVGLLHDQGQGVPEDANEAALWYRLAAEQGHPAAQNNLGMLYFDGRGVSVDYGKAEHWFTRAAEQDFAAAQNNLGVVRLLVAHTPEKEKAAHELLLAAAEAGDLKAQLTLAKLYERGLTVPKDDAQAAYWYGRAAAQGSPAARRHLAAPSK